jgi:hypothetical protein
MAVLVGLIIGSIVVDSGTSVTFEDGLDFTGPPMKNLKIYDTS